MQRDTDFNLETVDRMPCHARWGEDATIRNRAGSSCTGVDGFRLQERRLRAKVVVAVRPVVHAHPYLEQHKSVEIEVNAVPAECEPPRRAATEIA